jgi:nitrogenase molybdenum-iron protein alpha/beta subunit
MSIDKSIADLIAALDRNTAALQGAAGTTSAAASTEKAEKTTKGKATKEEAAKVTQEQVNAALIKIKDDFGMEHAKAIITDIGKAAKMAEIKPAQYQAVYDAAVKKHAELSEGGSEGGDDDI